MDGRHVYSRAEHAHIGRIHATLHGVHERIAGAGFPVQLQIDRAGVGIQTTCAFNA